jgi:hypoxanthine phosphoribosyltransferase
MSNPTVASPKEVTIKDKTFTIRITAEAIQARVKEIAGIINRDYEGKNPIIIGVLNGSVFFAVDLMRYLNMTCELSFIRVASYHGGLATSGQVTGIMGIKENLEGRHVLLVEDIVDTGITATHLVKEINDHQPASLKMATALFKPAALRANFKPDYVGFEVDPDFLIGYGLDYDGLARNLNDIYVLKS